MKNDQYLDKEIFKTLAELASCKAIFSSNGSNYRQVESLAMGIAPAPC